MKKLLIAYFATATAALAHPGHDAAVVEGQAHWLTQPDHIVVVGLSAALISLAGIRWSVRRMRALRE